MRTPRPWALPQQPTLRADLLVPGVSPAMLQTQLRSGRLVRVRPGVYLDAARWPADLIGQALARAHAEQAVRPGAALSHDTAALVWGVPCPGPGQWDLDLVHLTIERAGSHRGSAGVILHRPAKLPRHHLVQDAEGYGVTSLARTCVDLARAWDLPGALVLLDATARRLCEAMTSSPRRKDYANPRLAEAARASLVEAITTCRATRLLAPLALMDPARESPIESLTAAHLHRSGLPMPLFQAPIRTHRGTFYPDCLWPQHRLIGEADGAVKYTDPQAYVAEKEREQILRDLGYGIVRWLGREIMLEPAVVMDRIARALEARPPGLAA